MLNDLLSVFAVYVTLLLQTIIKLMDWYFNIIFMQKFASLLRHASRFTECTVDTVHKDDQAGSV